MTSESFYCSCRHDEAAHVGYEALVARTGGTRPLFGCTGCLTCQGMKPLTVFHIVIWIESTTGITMQLGLEGTIADRADAERVADAYRKLYAAGYVADGTQDQAHCTRVGILEITAPDPKLGHQPACTNVEQVLTGIWLRIAKRLGTTPHEDLS